MTTARTKRLTFEEWQALPETKQKCEVVDGVLVMPPSPFGEHAWVVQVILPELRTCLTENRLGIVLTAPYDVLINRDPLRVRQPDILVVNEVLTGIARPADLAGRPYLEGPPMLVVEVLSPSNTARDIEERLTDYRSIGVPECWLASFPSRNIQVLRLTAEGAVVVGTYGMGETLRSEVLPGFELAIDDVFGPLLGQGE